MFELNIPTASTTAWEVVEAAVGVATDTPSDIADALQAYNEINYAYEGSVVRSNDTNLLTAVTTNIANDIYNWCNQSSTVNTTCTGNHTGNHTSTGNDLTFILPWWRLVLWNILFGAMVIVATGGNLIVVWIVLTTKRMRTVTNYFIVNLSIADAMVSSLNVTFNYIYMLDNDWSFGELYCKISQFIATLSISASVFTLMAISIDRYVAIMKPLQPRMSKCCNLAIAATIWIVSIVIALPMLLFFKTDEVLSRDGIRTVCYAEWPDGQTNHSDLEYIYVLMFMILTYILPIISMTVTYSRVGIELWGSKAIGEYTPRQVENVRSKRRVVKMMIVVVLIFGVCWLPFHAWFIVTSCYPSITNIPFIQEVYLIIYWLAMSNSMYNPIIYCWMNSRFRYGFKHFFRWCPFVHVGAETLNRRDNMTSRHSCSGSPDHNRIKRNDTQRSLLYTCSDSPKTRRISHSGVLRNSTLITHRNAALYSKSVAGGAGGDGVKACVGGSGSGMGAGSVNFASSMGHGVGANSYHQRCSTQNANSHELSSLGGKDYMKLTSRNNLLHTRPTTKWLPPTVEVTGTGAALPAAVPTTLSPLSATVAGGLMLSERNAIVDVGRSPGTASTTPLPASTAAAAVAALDSS